MKVIGQEFKSQSSPYQNDHISDGDLIKIYMIKKPENLQPQVYNKYEKTSYVGNKDFISNAIDYLTMMKILWLQRTKQIRIATFGQSQNQKRTNYFCNLWIYRLPLKCWSYWESSISFIETKILLHLTLKPIHRMKSICPLLSILFVLFRFGKLFSHNEKNTKAV